MSATATLIETLTPSRKGQEIAVYRLSTPLMGYKFAGSKPWTYVIVSAVTHAYGTVRPMPETYIFGASCDGNAWTIADYTELPGSFCGGMSHGEALLDAGYFIVCPTNI